uniref:Plakophilin 4 n=1 Tax=Soboliphyme baturini TaxID=241478 RepID=A0A183IX98_9BILA
LQEVEDLNYDRNTSSLHARSRSAPAGSPKIADRKLSKKKSKANEKSAVQFLENPSLKPVLLLFAIETIKNYLLLLQNSTNPEVLEASAGAIQNLAACEWEPSLEVRTVVRKEKGLPILVELLRTDTEKVKCASAKALRNLALDGRNKELIGKYAMAELVSLLPGSIVEQNLSEETIITALSLIYTTTSKNPDFTRAFHERGGTERLVSISRSRTLYSSRVVMYTSQVLLAMWQHKDLHDMFYRSGFKDENFLLLPGTMRGSVDTLTRPVGTPGVEDYAQRLPGSENNVRSQFGSLNLRTEPLTPTNYCSTDYTSYSNFPHGISSGAPPTLSRTSLTMGDPLYSEVHKTRNRPTRAQSAHVSSVNTDEPAGDSWV